MGHWCGWLRDEQPTETRDCHSFHPCEPFKPSYHIQTLILAGDQQFKDPIITALNRNVILSNAQLVLIKMTHKVKKMQTE